MARGKYAARADRRREFAEIEQRATVAERQRDTLAGELAKSREHNERRIAGLVREVQELREQRDAAASPRISELEAANVRLRAERNAAKVMQEEFEEARYRFDERAVKAFQKLGLSVLEARELTDILVADDSMPRPVHAHGIQGTPSVIEAVQRARGQRTGIDIAEIAGDLYQGTEVSPRSRRERKEAIRSGMAIMLNEETASYSYDSAKSSVTLWNRNGEFHLCIDDAEPRMIGDSVLALISLPASEARRLVEVLRGGLS